MMYEIIWADPAEVFIKMDKLIIDGGHSIEGKVRVHGAKNAVLPILAATVLNNGKNTIYDCPDLKDVTSSVDILRFLGCSVKRDNDMIEIDSSGLKYSEIPENLMREMRSSVIFLGPILSRFRKAVIAMPGGCEIGLRPIDLHLKAFRQLGVEIQEEHGYIKCRYDKIKPCTIHLDFPSVGATENIMLLSVLADGTSIITNAAKEPEIVDLQNYLNAMGAKIYGAGTSIIRIDGVKRLNNVVHRVIPDRIVAATYLACCAAAGGEIEIENVKPAHMEAFLSAAEGYGAKLYISDNKIIHKAPQRLRALKLIRTQPHPGFPTDAQSPLMAAMTVGDGTSIFVENIFESRYKNVYELCRMGADITVDGRMAVVRGVKELSGANVCALDLRGGASLVVAALAAHGRSCINNVHHIDRGYDKIEYALSMLGAKISRVRE